MAVLAFGAQAQVDVRVRLMRVEHHHVAVVRELSAREGAGRLLHGRRRRAGRHRKHHIDGFTPGAALRDQRPGVAPLLHERLHAVLAVAHHAAVVFDG